MITVTGVSEMKALVRKWKADGLTVGFVPTMGFLHEGHLSLVRESRRRSGATAVSIFVNPAQFGPHEDFSRYPRDFERDAALLEKEGVDVLFYPSVEEMYPAGYETYVEVRDLQDRLCGKSRPGHFRGVATIVLKLLNIAEPDLAFFGWKDAQQVVILRKMVSDLDVGTKIVACPLVREPDGLAMSSRNSYLSPEDRKAALILSRSLAEAERTVAAGERSAEKVIARIRAGIEAEPLARIDYVEAVDMLNLEPVAEIHGDVLIALAVFFGSTRLIDNIRIHARGEPL
jgi:pantoate--beta-alanine ligase